jgi:predicted ATP-grasp superfamily ATP-dependent carboligase
MNMFYTGLGIARSLGRRRVRVIGLSAHRSVYGNYTRYAEIRFCPDSREDPDGLLGFLVGLGRTLESPAVIFPTRDDDVLFLNRFRDRLGERYIPVIPSSQALEGCLDKWETYSWARQAGIPVPRCWKVETKEDVVRVVSELSFPCVLKPLSAHHWRMPGNWQRVGARKAIGVSSAEELHQEYDRIARADGRALLQEMVPGGDDQLLIVACYFNRESKLIGSFTAQKLAQVPEVFGTGCIVRTVDRPELIGPAARLLKEMRFSGIAEVEFKWDAPAGQYKLIEVNPRPWDQHRLGNACGVDLIHLAYCDLAGLSIPEVKKQAGEYKWIAEDVFFRAAVRSLWRRDGKFRSLCRLAKGRRIYGIWSALDPLPSLLYITTTYLGGLVVGMLRAIVSGLGRRMLGKQFLQEKNAL